MPCKTLTMLALQGLQSGDRLSHEDITVHLSSCAECQLDLGAHENALRRIDQLTLETFLQGVDVSEASPLPMVRRSGMIKWAFLAAAVLLLATGVFFLTRTDPQFQPDGNPTVIRKPSLPAGIPPLRVVEILSHDSHPIAIVRDILDMRTVSLEEGSLLQGYAVSEITDSLITLTHATNGECHLGPDSHRQEWDSYLSDINHYYQEKLQTQNMSAADFQEMTRYIYSGEEEMLSLLETMSDREGQPYSGEIRNILSGGGRTLSQLKRLIHMAETDSDLNNRKYAIQALGRNGSPLARSALRRLLRNRSNPLVLLVVQQVVLQHDILAIQPLVALQQDEGLAPSAMTTITDAIRTLTENKE